MSSGDNPVLLSLTNAGIRRAGRWIVNNISVSVRKNEIVTMIGPNGAGKSTVAKMLLGVIKPDRGEAAQMKGVRIGYVPQTIKIDWSLPLSVARFMALTQRLKMNEMLTALGRTGADHLIHSHMRDLSGGEMQRVMLARAIALKPDILVLDEPVQGVDFAGQIALYNLIKSLRSELGCAIFIISHDLNIVMAGTDRVICLNGHVCCQGTPTMVKATREFQSLFGKEAAETHAVYSHHHDHVHLPDGRVEQRDPQSSNAQGEEHHHA